MQHHRVNAKPSEKVKLPTTFIDDEPNQVSW